MSDLDCSEKSAANHEVRDENGAQKCRRIILKFGSGILTQPAGDALDLAQISRLADEIAALVVSGHECAIVSSGAVAAGMSALGFSERPRDLAARQACAAIGQSRLMRAYETAFDAHDLHVAQLLLTHGDLDSRQRYANAKNTLERLFAACNVVPIINENDSVAVEELRFGDNDRLSAEVAMLARAELLILLTSVDGLLDENGATIPEIRALDDVRHLVKNEVGKFSVGGMESKLQTAQMAVNAGIRTVIANGRTPGQIPAIAHGEPVGTRFVTAR